MSLLQAITLGLIQGLTEFLPVSSSGHLVIAQNLFDLKQPPLVMDSLLHLATLVAVLAYFRREISELVRAAWVYGRYGRKTQQLPLVGYLAVASLPAAFIGATFEDMFANAFESIGITGAMLLVTAVFLWAADGQRDLRKLLADLNIGDSLWVGVFQSLAIMPGISRSGATIAAGIFRGYDRNEAAKFSFLLSVPAILGAALFSFFSNGVNLLNPGLTVVAMAVAGTSGFFAIALLMKIIKRQTLRLFSLYCFIVGSLAVILALKG